VRTADGRQINLLAVSKLPAKRLIGIMRGRWEQENGFKHGVERWGINQLDGRATQPCPPGHITVTLAPAANRSERKAIRALLQEVTKWRLTLPDDPRPLRFQSQV
jgi:hypothetical protein